MKKLTMALSMMLCSASAVADVDPWVVASDIPGLIGDLWPNGKRSSKGLSYEGSQETATSGTISVMAYNVDGFPESIGGNSKNDFKNIVKTLNTLNYDIVNMQELFTKDKHDKLRDYLSEAQYPYRSDHHRGSRTSFGSGLVRLSTLPFDKNNGFDREDWNDCYDIDCYTEKGFTFQRHHLANNIMIDVYNMHNDAGGQDGDIKAKRVAMRQLASYINTHSAGNAVIVAGDYNLSWHDESKDKSPEFLQIVQEFLSATSMQFVCEVTHGAAYSDPLDGCKYHFPKPDRIAFKSGDSVQLTAEHLEFVEGIFVDDKGDERSDHLPLAAQFSWGLRN